MNKPFLSIIIPAYNEEKRIKNSLTKLINFIESNNKLNFEIIIIDDGSRDNTNSIIKDFFLNCHSNCLNYFNFVLIENLINRGKGYSVRRGLEKASGNYILFTDADLSTPLEESLKMIDILKNGYDIVIGSRALKKSLIVKRQNIIREYMGKFFNFIVRKITKLNFFDTQCGFKMFTKKAVKLLLPYLKIDDFSFDVEILYVANKLNLKIKELPVIWANSPNSKVNIIKDPIKMFLSLFKIRFKIFNKNIVD